MTLGVTRFQKEDHVVDVPTKLFQHARVGGPEQFLQLCGPVTILLILLQVVNVKHGWERKW